MQISMPCALAAWLITTAQLTPAKNSIFSINDKLEYYESVLHNCKPVFFAHLQECKPNWRTFGRRSNQMESALSVGRFLPGRAYVPFPCSRDRKDQAPRPGRNCAGYCLWRGQEQHLSGTSRVQGDRIGYFGCRPGKGGRQGRNGGR